MKATTLEKEPLEFTATGLLVLYLLWDIRPVAGKTMNAVLVEHLSSGWPLGAAQGAAGGQR